jgi:hydrogenase/urease accessory protein HupE
VRTPVFGAMLVVAFFAVFHGHAHGTELAPGHAGHRRRAGVSLGSASMNTRIFPFAAGLLLLPSLASAHLVTSGLGPFYDGALHLLLSPADLVGPLAVTLLAGLRGSKAGRWTVVVLPIAWLTAGVIGLQAGVEFDLPWVSVLLLLVLGVLVASDAKLPACGVAALAGLFGALQGLANGAALAKLGAGSVAMLGITGSTFVLTLLVCAAVASLRPAWTRVAVRAVGSWVAAVGMLMFGWLSRTA